MLRSRTIAVASLLLFACNAETKYDVFMQGQKVEGEAERGPCKLHYTADSPAAVINGDMVNACLQETEKAIALYEKAQSMGYADIDFDQVYTRAKERRERLISMREMVRGMEKEQNTPEQPF